MTTYRKRLEYLEDALEDEDCQPRVWMKYMYEASAIRRRLTALHGPERVEPDDEINA